MEQQNKVSWGATSKLLLASFAASLAPLIQQISQTGELPTKETAVSFGLLGLFGLFRVTQQVFLDYLSGRELPYDPFKDDDAVDEVPTEPTDVNPDVLSQ